MCRYDQYKLIFERATSQIFFPYMFFFNILKEGKLKTRNNDAKLSHPFTRNILLY